MNKKERDRLKRQKKQKELHKQRNQSIFKTLADSPAQYECYINSEWQDTGEASIHVLLQVPKVGTVLVAFMVDLLCMGLKDAFGRTDLTRQQIDEIFDEMNEMVAMEQTDIDTVKRLVSGGIRFARENHFRLPHRFDRWVGLIGIKGDCVDADLSGFAGPGELVYTGSLEELKRTYIGDPEEFLARDDVEFALRPENVDELMDLEEVPEDERDKVKEMMQNKDLNDSLDQLVDVMTRRVADVTRKWCFANSMMAHPMLDQAAAIMFETVAQVGEGGDEEGGNAQPRPTHQILDASIDATHSPEEAAGIKAAMAQIEQCMHSYPNEEAFLAATGITEDDFE